MTWQVSKEAGSSNTYHQEVQLSNATRGVLAWELDDTPIKVRRLSTLTPTVTDGTAYITQSAPSPSAPKRHAHPGPHAMPHNTSLNSHSQYRPARPTHHRHRPVMCVEHRR